MTDYRYPPGVEGALNIYITSDSTGLQALVKITGLPKPVEPPPQDALSLLAAFERDAEIANLADDWRLMTREEIRQYKDDNDD